MAGDQGEVRQLALRVQDIGQIDEALLLFGGPYSNLEATRALMKAADRLSIPPARRICTGDVVAYCADAAASWDMVSGGAHIVAGNCEQQLASGAADCGCGFEDGTACDRWSGQWYAHARQEIRADQAAAMGACPDILTFTHCGQRAAVIHGGVTDIARFIWPSHPDAVFAEEIAALRAIVGPVDMIIAGHSGLAFERVVEGVRWINAGVIGMPPHDGRPETRFATLTDGQLMIHRLAYDAETAAAKMRAATLPHGYADALISGIWPSEDVLPTALRR